MLETAKMKTENEEISNESQIAQNKETAPAENSSSELKENIWSVVSFESVIANNLTYNEAREKLNRLAEKKVSGLCIITDEAAERI